MNDIQTWGYLLLVATVIALMVLLVRADRIETMLENEVTLNANSAAFWCSMYCIANQANNSMAEALEQYRTTFGELIEEAQPAPVAPTVDTDTLISNMKYCLACHTWQHDQHFVIYRLHASGMPPA